MRYRFLLLCDGLEHISRTGDVREIDLGLDLFFATQRTCSFRCVCRGFGCTPNVSPHLFSFVFLERTGVGLLLRDSNNREHIKNGLAFYFQFSCEIVNSYLTHPPFLCAPRCA